MGYDEIGKLFEMVRKMFVFFKREWLWMLVIYKEIYLCKGFLMFFFLILECIKFCIIWMCGL